FAISCSLTPKSISHYRLRPMHVFDGFRHLFKLPVHLLRSSVEGSGLAVMPAFVAGTYAADEKLKHPGEKHHIRNTPNFVSGIGAFSAAEKHRARTRRVSVGVMMPSSHSRAVA